MNLLVDPAAYKTLPFVARPRYITWGLLYAVAMNKDGLLGRERFHAALCILAFLAGCLFIHLMMRSFLLVQTYSNKRLIHSMERFRSCIPHADAYQWCVVGWRTAPPLYGTVRIWLLDQVFGPRCVFLIGTTTWAFVSPPLFTKNWNHCWMHVVNVATVGRVWVEPFIKNWLARMFFHSSDNMLKITAGNMTIGLYVPQPDVVCAKLNELLAANRAEETQGE